MNKVYQDKLGELDGNCLAACLASIFEVGLSDVPLCKPDTNIWWSEITEWCHERGCHPLRVDEVGDSPCYSIAILKLSGGDKHAVVWRAGNAHDPMSGANELSLKDQVLRYSHDPVCDFIVFLPLYIQSCEHCRCICSRCDCEDRIFQEREAD